MSKQMLDLIKTIFLTALAPQIIDDNNNVFRN